MRVSLLFVVFLAALAVTRSDMMGTMMAHNTGKDNIKISSMSDAAGVQIVFQHLNGGEPAGGYVGIGVCLKNNMMGSDIAFITLDDTGRNPAIKDKYALNNGSPQDLTTNNWELVSNSIENDNRTFVVKRPYTTPNEGKGVEIKNKEKLYIIWAWKTGMGHHENDNRGATMEMVVLRDEKGDSKGQDGSGCDALKRGRIAFLITAFVIVQSHFV